LCAGLLLPALCAILARHADEPQAAAAAAAALVNMSSEPSAARQAVEAGVVETAAAQIQSRDESVAERCAMLLANLTNPQHAGPEGASRLIDSNHLGSVLSAFESATAAEAPRMPSPFESATAAATPTPNHVPFLLGALTHVLASDEGRAAMLTHPSAVALLSRLCALLAPRSPHMPAAARAMRNLGFAARPGAAGQAALVALLCSSEVVSRLALPLAPHDTGEKATGDMYEKDEIRAFSTTLQDNLPKENSLKENVSEAGQSGGGEEIVSPAVREAGLTAGILALDNVPDHATRLALLEALLLLSAAPEACEAMRREGIFPVLRESRAMMLLAEDEAHRPAIDANENLVSIFHLGAGGGGQAAPGEANDQQPRGKFVWEVEEEARKGEETRSKGEAVEPRQPHEEVDD
jgi:hypothetical protein